MPSDQSPSAPENAGAETDETAPEEVPMNRAERRAKGKHKTQQHLLVNKINPGKTSQGHAQRNFSSRRSGG